MPDRDDLRQSITTRHTDVALRFAIGLDAGCTQAPSLLLTPLRDFICIDSDVRLNHAFNRAAALTIVAFISAACTSCSLARN
jgi:hypothetical protein